MAPDLETYREDVIRSMTHLGDWYREEASRILGIPVASVWIHGSVLDPDEFSDDSDVDLAIVVDVADLPEGMDDALSDKLDGVLPDGVSGAVDVIVLNRMEPYGRSVPPLRISGPVETRGPRQAQL